MLSKSNIRTEFGPSMCLFIDVLNVSINRTFKMKHSELLSLPQTVSDTGHITHLCCLQSIQEGRVLPCTLQMSPVSSVFSICLNRKLQ